MSSVKNNPVEDTKKTTSNVKKTGDAASENQPSKVDSPKPVKDGAVETAKKSLVSEDALSIYARIEKIIAEITAKDDQDLMIKGC